MKAKLSLILFILFTVISSSIANERFAPKMLKCGQKINPVGIDAENVSFSWNISSKNRSFRQKAYRVLVSDSETLISQEKGNIWDSKKIISDQSILIPYGGGALESGKKYYWRVMIWDPRDNYSYWSPVQTFRMGLASESDWSGASWIAYEQDGDHYAASSNGYHVNADVSSVKSSAKTYILPQFRKEFFARNNIKNATVYICGLGQYDLFLNGKKVGDNFLDPGWTKFDKRVLYQSFDVTKSLKMGQNAIGVMVGNGFFHIPNERYRKILTNYGAPKMICKMVIEYADGSNSVVVSDASWKGSESAIKFSSIYGGEDYDAATEQHGWKEVGFNDGSWTNAMISSWNAPLIAQHSEPLKIMEQISAVRKFKNSKGEWIYDMGQNFSGIPYIEVEGIGAVKMYPAEVLDPDSTISQVSGGAPVWFTYNACGKGVEKWHPQFTYYGFRYIRIEGGVPLGEANKDNMPVVHAIKGLHTRNSAMSKGSFQCSDELFNKIYTLIDWSVKSNFASVLTDCPHREKLGWLECSHLVMPSIQYQYDVSTFCSKIIDDMASTQRDNGMIATTAPEFVEFAHGFLDTPEWGSAFIILPWYVYQWYGDIAPIKKHYPSMQRYYEYLSSKAEGNIVSYGLGDWCDLGPNPSGGAAQLTSNALSATAIYRYNSLIMAKIALMLGNRADAEKYNAKAEEIKQAFNAKFFDEATQTYDRNSQTANAMAIYMGLADGAKGEIAHKNLIADIRNRGNALTAGDVGYRYVLRVLGAANDANVVYDMNSRDDVPGYGFQIAKGETSLAESWNSFSTNSHNHCMLGHLMEWLYADLGGISQTETSIAYKELRIKPSHAGGMKHTVTTFNTPYGEVLCDSDMREGYKLKVTVPANCSAEVTIPVTCKEVTENGISVTQNSDMAVTKRDGKMVINIGSGEYLFSAQ